MVEKILEIAKKKCDEADIIIKNFYNLGISYISNEVDNLYSSESQIVGLRVIKDGRLGIAHTRKMDFKEDEIVERAILNSKYGPKCYFKLPPKISAKKVETYHENVLRIDQKEMKISCEREINKIRDKFPDLLVSADFSKNTSSTRFLNTNSTDEISKRTGLDFDISIRKNIEGDLLEFGSGKFLRKFDKELYSPTENTIKLYEWSKNIVELKTGKYDVFIHPDVFYEILYVILSSLNGKNVLLGNSYFKDNLNAKVLDEKINIWEDPFSPWGASTASFDDEGSETAAKDLIKNGVIKTFYYDLQTAAEAGVKSTGNGWRSLSSQANPILTNVFMEGGSKTEDEIIKGIKKGIYLKTTMGGFTNNPYSGDMSLQCLHAFKIENGEIKGRVKDTMIFFNVFEILKNNILEISKDREWEGKLFIPGVLFKDLSIAAKE